MATQIIDLIPEKGGDKETMVKSRIQQYSLDPLDPEPFINKPYPKALFLWER